MTEEKEGKPNLAPCQRCGHPFAKKKQLERVGKKLTIPAALIGMCPDCRAQQLSEDMARTLGQAQSTTQPDV